ncbi:MAG: leucyl aminopeptidase [Burkholderiales bacterium]
MIELEFLARATNTAPMSAVAVLVFEQSGPGDEALDLDVAASGMISRALGHGRLTASTHQAIVLTALADPCISHIVVVGVCGRGMFDEHSMEDAAARAYATAKSCGASSLELRVWSFSAELSAHAALGLRLASYRFDKYRTREKAGDRPSLQAARIVVQDPAQAAKEFAPLARLADAIGFARDLVSEPPNVLYPEEFARRVKALEVLGLQVDILDEQQMVELGMGALLSVGQGSARQSQLAVMAWYGATRPSDAPVVVAGKGVCFDSGGLSLKEHEGMWEMKWDMGGAAAVAGLMHVLATRQAKANVVGILGLVENMPDGAASRPGDVVTSMSGQTIEIVDTDSEGRLVLADALWYGHQRFNPAALVDVATLTSAIIIALGHHYAGVFSNDDSLANQLLAAADREGELLWRMPLHRRYRNLIDSPIADMKNYGGQTAGSILAALFLEPFAGSTPWAHLDIAPAAWRKESDEAMVPDGATGYGVRLLNRWIAQYHEDRTA